MEPSRRKEEDQTASTSLEGMSKHWHLLRLCHHHFSSSSSGCMKSASGCWVSKNRRMWVLLTKTSSTKHEWAVKERKGQEETEGSCACSLYRLDLTSFEWTPSNPGVAKKSRCIIGSTTGVMPLQLQISLKEYQHSQPTHLRETLLCLPW